MYKPNASFVYFFVYFFLIPTYPQIYSVLTRTFEQFEKKQKSLNSYIIPKHISDYSGWARRQCNIFKSQLMISIFPSKKEKMKRAILKLRTLMYFGFLNTNIMKCCPLLMTRFFVSAHLNCHHCQEGGVHQINLP